MLIPGYVYQEALPKFLFLSHVDSLLTIGNRHWRKVATMFEKAESANSLRIGRPSVSKQVSALGPLSSKRLRARAERTYLQVALPSVSPSLMVVVSSRKLAKDNRDNASYSLF